MVARMSRLSMVEFPTSSSTASARFVEAVFGWAGVAYGPQYHDVPLDGGVSLGFQADPTEAPGCLVVIEVNDLTTTRATVLAAGGTITVEPFGFPGGTRMHFREPGGNEMAAFVPDPA